MSRHMWGVCYRGANFFSNNESNLEPNDDVTNYISDFFTFIWAHQDSHILSNYWPYYGGTKCKANNIPHRNTNSDPVLCAFDKPISITHAATHALSLSKSKYFSIAQSYRMFRLRRECRL